MSQWYYADDARTRTGPLSADELRDHYRQRRLRRDSLVWREGMAQWQPLASVAGELGVDAITPDAALPPPLPGGEPAPGFTPVRTVRATKKPMSGCLIAVLVCAGLAVPVTAILAAIAIPAYNDYVQRAKVMEAVAGAASLRQAMAEYVAAEDACPGEDSPGLAAPVQQLASNARVAAVRVGTVEGGRCAFELTLQAVGTRVDGHTLLFAAADEAATRWNCDGGDLPARYRPAQCRPSSTPTN